MLLALVLLTTLQLAAAVRADVLVAAHRGNSISAPENTIASIDAATGLADLSEMDVRVTADGQLVLMHDANVRRTTDGNGPVKRRTLDELQSLRRRLLVLERVSRRADTFAGTGDQRLVRCRC